MISSATEESEDDEGREDTSTQESTGRVSAYMLEAVLIADEAIVTAQQQQQ